MPCTNYRAVYSVEQGNTKINSTEEVEQNEGEEYEPMEADVDEQTIVQEVYETIPTPQEQTPENTYNFGRPTPNRE